MIDGDENSYGEVYSSSAQIPYVKIDLERYRKITAVKSYFYAMESWGDLAVEVGYSDSISTSTNFQNKFCTWGGAIPIFNKNIARLNVTHLHILQVVPVLIPRAEVLLEHESA